MTNDKSKKIRVRFAPSPTGTLHFGATRTALFNYLFSENKKGDLILRIEDTDTERSEIKWEKDIIESLKWLGIKYNEFYRQSERKDIYAKYIKKLLDEDKAYYCFCSKQELKEKQNYAFSQGKAPVYDKKCSNLDKKTIKKYLDEKKPCIIRFRCPTKKIIFQDIIRGKIEFDFNLLGDFAIAKNINSPLYNLAVVIDDYDMKINFVIRGEDHISNTPRQILLSQALGFDAIKYAHIPLILGPDKSKLSKRHGAESISEYREKGYLREALINFMAFLGWNPGTEKEIFSMEELIKEFTLEKIQKSGAIFNINRLNYLNGLYIRNKDINELTKLCIPYLIKTELIAYLDDEENLENAKYKIINTNEIIDFNYIKQTIEVYQERLKFLSEIPELTDFFFKDKLEYDKDLLKWKNMDNNEVVSILDKLENILSEIKTENFNRQNLEKILIAEAEKIGDRGKLLWPLRVALSGKKASASPFEIASIIGKEKTIDRIKYSRGLFE
ncbi:MAG: glutamate--tRNA ligase [Patescibacteria group bacterium]|nr:glutamate--tRNA ligase [Patescibacteria group bacterium]